MQKSEPIWTTAYKEWYRLNRWIADNSKGLNQGQKAELLNSLTRRLTSLSFRGEKDAEEIVHRKFLQELASKQIKIKGDIRKLSMIQVPSVPSSFLVQNGVFKCGEFYSTLSPERYKLLRERGSDEQVLAMLLTYALYASPSLSWQIPKAVYQCMVEKHGLTLEGCASPVNSQLLPLNGRYCSPSFETDAVFGSLGGIFENDLSGEIAFVNPPFVEDFMEAVALKIETTLKETKKPTTIIFVGPKWEDSKFYTMLSASPHRVLTHQLSKGHHSYEDSSTCKKVLAKFDSIIFVLTGPLVPEGQKIADFSDAFALFK